MHVLRNTAFLARLVLAWFALSIGVAVAAPMVQAQALELVCSAGGSMKLVVQGDPDAGKPLKPHSLECPLCLGTGAPPAVMGGVTPAEFARDLPHAPPAARFAALILPAPPARGPPVQPAI